MSRTDICEIPDSIQLLSVADVVGKLLTGRRELLWSGLITLETYLGYNVIRKVYHNIVSKEKIVSSTTSMFVKEAEITVLWRLHSLEKNYPIKKTV